MLRKTDVEEERKYKQKVRMNLLMTIESIPDAALHFILSQKLWIFLVHNDEEIRKETNCNTNVPFSFHWTTKSLQVMKFTTSSAAHFWAMNFSTKFVLVIEGLHNLVKNLLWYIFITSSTVIRRRRPIIFF